jgi:hypothetical protein
MDTLTPFKWRHFQAEIILLCVRWYLRVRHVTHCSIPSETERTRRGFFGSRAYLAPKGNGNNSMLLKQDAAKAL